MTCEELTFSETDAMKFCISPPDHEYHLTFGSNGQKATPESLQAGGLWVELVIHP